MSASFGFSMISLNAFADATHVVQKLSEWLQDSGFKDRGFKDRGFKEGGFKDTGFKDGGFRDTGFKDGGFKDSFGLVWFTPMLFLLIDSWTFTVELGIAPRATLAVIRLSSRPWPPRFDFSNIR